MPRASAPISLAIVGVGPRGTGVLERIAANLPLMAPGLELTIHLIDPFPAGAGRIWRAEQSPLLRLNSMAADVTMFTDESSTIDGPIVPGPSLIEWAAQVRSGSIVLPDHARSDAALVGEITALEASSFPTRRLQSVYLDWFHRRAVAALPPSVRTVAHADEAVAVDRWGDGRSEVRLLSGERLVVDTVIFAIGHTGAEPDADTAGLVDFAASADLFYLPPAFTADADLTAIAAGENVIVRGMGLAGVDLTVLLTEGRGGRYVPDSAGRLEYLQSGNEPHIHLGSRRGVPYRSKVGSQLKADRVTPRFFTAAVAATLEASSDRLSFIDDVWPLIAKELLWGYYGELFAGHTARVLIGWDEFAEAFAPLQWDSADLATLIARAVPDPVDRLDLANLDRPLAGVSFESGEDLQAHLRDHIERDLHLRSAEDHSATLALFYSLLFSYFDLGGIVDSPKWSARSRVEELGPWWTNFFSYVASGPPAQRLHELLALSRAGVVSFLGADTWVRADAELGHFVAGSPSLDHEVHARALVDARLPAATISASDNPLLRSLLASGAGVEEVLDDGEFRGTTGRLLVSPGVPHLIDVNGIPHPSTFAIGPYTSAPFVGAFSRPRTNAVSFRENDRVARAALGQLLAAATARMNENDGEGALNPLETHVRLPQGA